MTKASVVLKYRQKINTTNCPTNNIAEHIISDLTSHILRAAKKRFSCVHKFVTTKSSFASSNNTMTKFQIKNVSIRTVILTVSYASSTTQYFLLVHYKFNGYYFDLFGYHVCTLRQSAIIAAFPQQQKTDYSQGSTLHESCPKFSIVYHNYLGKQVLMNRKDFKWANHLLLLLFYLLKACYDTRKTNFVVYT